MDGRGGCCIARYAAGATYDMSKMDRIMLRFRPIAPKPAASENVSGSSTAENNGVHVSNGRGKRKYIRDGNKKCTKRKRKSSPETSSGGSVSGGDPVVTLTLLPETPDRKDDLSSPKKQPIWLNFGNNDNDNNNNNNNDNHAPSVVEHVSIGLNQTVLMMPKPVRVVGSVVSVECVTETWVDGYGLGFTDEERRMSLEWDTCPGFLSDGLDRVSWTNGAYREIVDSEGGGREVVVWLVVRERVPMTCPAFTCRVRLQYSNGSLTVPCDVWKMDGGGFAWRLDLKAALSLGR